MASYLEKAKLRQQKVATRLAEEPQATQQEDSQQTLPADVPGSQDAQALLEIQQGCILDQIIISIINRIYHRQ